MGHPNVGKSVVFSRLTGRYITCSNYPGTTVELYRGGLELEGEAWEILDTPGVVELASPREDEQATRDLLLFGDLDVVVQVADAKNVERSLSLFLQLAGLGLPVVLDLNMVDERRACGLRMRDRELARRLGVPLVETVATSGEGLDDLRRAIGEAAVPAPTPRWGRLAPAVDAVRELLGENPLRAPARAARAAACSGACHPVGVAPRLLGPEGADTADAGHDGNGRRPGPTRDGLAALLLAMSEEDCAELVADLELPDARRRRLTGLVSRLRANGTRPGFELTVLRRDHALQLLDGIVTGADTSATHLSSPVPPTPAVRTSPVPPTPAVTTSLGPPTPAVTASPGVRWGRRLARWTVHPVWGVMIFVAVLYGMYQFVGKLGAVVMVDWLEETLFGEWINPAIVGLADRFVTVSFVHDMLVGEYGLFTMALTYAVALILPIVTAFFLAFGFLEDSGYFPRLSVMAHRLFAVMGLSGQAVLPMILGLSCDTMATVTTRVLDTRKERVIATLLLALGVPCSAQLAVLLAMSAAVSPAVLAGVLGIVGLQLIIVGRLASAVLPGDTSSFVAELPPLRWPRWQNIAAKTRLRLVWYATEVLPLFVIGTFALFLLDQAGALARFEDLVRPVVRGFLGLPAEASTAFVMGFFRRDYGAAGMYQLQQQGALDTVQVLVSLVVITLFVPCIANLLVIVKERGWKTAAGIVGFIIPYSILVGGVVNTVARWVVTP